VLGALIKSDAISIGTHQQCFSYSSLISVDVASSTVTLAGNTKILGVTLDKYLTVDDHVSAVCKSAFYHIRTVHHIRPSITNDMAKSVVSALNGTRLDNLNSSTLFCLVCHQKMSPVFNMRRTLPLPAEINKLFCFT